MATDDDHAFPTSNDEAPEVCGIEAVFGDYIERLNAGERISRWQIEKEHPQYASELIEQLELFQDGVLEREAHSPPLGTLGDYTLHRQIGRGGMGVVYEAWQESLDRQVALKVLPAGIAADNKAFLRFMREAKTAAQLNHQNVVSVHGMGVEQDTPYYSMEYVEGETLAQFLAKIKNTEPDTETPFGKKDCASYFERLARAFADVADGLQHAHSKGIVHRDIKPSNLILDSEDRLRILDFGLARLEGQESLTLSGDFVGTPLYMSPEQARRKKVPIDHRADIYSLGATMYEALTGCPPFRGKDHADTLSQIIERDPRPPRQFSPRIPADLATIVLKCLRKSPADRYGTAEALSQDLGRFARGAPIEARAQPAWEPLLRRAWRLRRRAAALLVTLLLVFAAFREVRIGEIEREQQLAEQYVETVEEGVRLLQASFLTTRVATLGARSIDAHRGRMMPASEGPLEEAGSVQDALAVLDEAVRLLPERPDAYYHRGRAYLLMQRKGDAVEELERCLGLDPHFTPALALNAALGRHAVNMAGATQAPALVEKDAQDPTQVFWHAAQEAMFAARWKEAAEAYSQLLALESSGQEPFLGSRIETRLGRGIARFQSEDLLGAIEDLMAAQALWPDSIEPALLLGRAYVARGETQAAQRTFSSLLSRRTGRERDRLAVSIISAYRTFNRNREALGWANEIEDKHLQQRSRAAILCSLGNFVGAREACGGALSAQPDDAIVHHIQAMTHYREGDLDSALEWSLRARGLDSRNPYIRNGLGVIYENLGRYEEAFSEFAEAVKLDPYWSTPRYSWGVALGISGRLQEAEIKYREAIQLERGNFDERERSWPWEGLVRCLTRQGRLNEAVASARKALEMFPEEADLWELLGDALEMEGHSADAFAAYGRAVVRDRDGGFGASKKLFELHHRAREPSDVAAAWRDLVDELETKALRSVENHPWLLVALGLGWLHGRGDLSKARDYISFAVDRSERQGPDSLAALAEVEMQDPEPDLQAAILALEEMLELEGADRSLETRLERGRRDFLPKLASLKSVDALLSSHGGREALADLEAIKENNPRDRQLYLEARKLQLAGEFSESASLFTQLRKAGLDGPRVTLRLAECLRGAGNPAAAERLLREALGGVSGVGRDIWTLWLRVSLNDLRRSPGELLTDLSRESEDAYYRDVVWLLERLEAGDAIRINCGGKAYSDDRGRAWGEDRFFLGGRRSKRWEADIAGVLGEPLYRTERVFSRRNKARYSIPLPQGRYKVRLHFAEFRFQPASLRRFDVRSEGQLALESYEPAARGFRAADVREFTREVRDGALDVEFARESGDPKVSALEVERADRRDPGDHRTGGANDDADASRE